MFDIKTDLKPGDKLRRLPGKDLPWSDVIAGHIYTFRGYNEKKGIYCNEFDGWDDFTYWELYKPLVRFQLPDELFEVE